MSALRWSPPIITRRCTALICCGSRASKARTTEELKEPQQ
jgi:hypothetical protein